MHSRGFASDSGTMRNKIGWWRRDEEGRKYQVQFQYFGGNFSWRRQMARYEDWEPHQPDEEDWERAEKDMDDRFRRGLVDEKILIQVRQREVN